MIKSMTGYGRGEALLSGGKMTIEIRSLNGKNADINLKTSLIPKEKELDLRRKIADRLRRGTIDLYITWEPAAGEAARPLNADAVKAYYDQVIRIRRELPGTPYPNREEMNDILTKMRALAIHAANNGVTAPDQVAADQAEVCCAAAAACRFVV